jgi:sugar/nucleoside kinase (ribokinase family)
MTTSNSQALDNSKKRRFEILGIGTPILDYLINVSDEYIKSLSTVHGSSVLIDYSSLQKILSKLTSQKMVSGGCAANAIKGLTRQGHSCGFFGKIGKDEPGKIFSESIESYGVISLVKESELPTGQVICLITPNHERTMRAYLGAGAEMDQRDLKKEFFEGVRLVHIEGYLLNRDAVVETAMKFAKEAGALISFDLSSFEIVNDYKKYISELLCTYVNIVFANEEEAHTLTGLPPEKACSLLKDLCQIAVVKAGANGCWGSSKTESTFHASYPVNVVDTTGAGDLFASGFLHSYLQEKSLEECLRNGSYLASRVIQVFGAEISEKQWLEITNHL